MYFLPEFILSVKDRCIFTLHELDNDANITVNLEDLNVGGRMLLK